MRMCGSHSLFTWIAFICLTYAVVDPRSGHAQSDKSDQAAKILGEARQALGGDARIAAVKTFVANGRTRQVRGDNLVPIEFEIQSELPDKYARRDEIPAQDTGPTTTGFHGERLIQLPVPATPVGRPGGPPPPTPAQLEAASRGRVTTAKQDFARLMLGMFASSFSSFPLTFAYAGQAEAPQGRADMIDVTGPANFAARLFIHSETHLPIMISWQVRPPAGPQRAGGAPPAGAGGPPPAAAAREGPPQPAPAGGAARAGGPPPQTPPVENRVYFADYREVDGLQLPFRIRRAVAADTIEETTFDRFRINARINARWFDAGN